MLSRRTSISPDGQSLLVVGNNDNAKLVDAHTGRITKSLRGHSNDVISSAWHPGGNILATGSEDKTCRIWDIRKESESVFVLKGNIGSIRSISFTSDGQFMAMAEIADFVHIYDVNQDFDQNQKQEVDFFGDITGVSFSPDTESLFIGVAPHYMFKNTTLLWYNRYRNFNYYQHFQNQMGF